jgi:hypothetical protein
MGPFFPALRLPSETCTLSAAKSVLWLVVATWDILLGPEAAEKVGIEKEWHQK